VATIQATQGEITRLDHPQVLVIEGGPGTGKTVVALHRVTPLEVLSRRDEDKGMAEPGSHLRAWTVWHWALGRPAARTEQTDLEAGNKEERCARWWAGVCVRWTSAEVVPRSVGFEVGSSPERLT
jgi:hypothetical protein